MKSQPRKLTRTWVLPEWTLKDPSRCSNCGYTTWIDSTLVYKDGKKFIRRIKRCRSSAYDKKGLCPPFILDENEVSSETNTEENALLKSEPVER